MAARPWTDDDDAHLRELAAIGTPIRTIAARVDRTRSAVDRRLRALHTGIDRSGTVAATTAHVIDATARRAALRTDLLGDAEQMRRQIFAPTKVFNFGGKDNTFNERKVDQPPFADQLKIAQAVQTLVASIERLEKMDTDNGLEQAVGMLDQIAAAITAAATPMLDLDQVGT